MPSNIRVRVADLRVELFAHPVTWRAWLIIGGTPYAAHGRVDLVADVEADVRRFATELYERLVGRPYEGKAL